MMVEMGKRQWKRLILLLALFINLLVIWTYTRAPDSSTVPTTSDRGRYQMQHHLAQFHNTSADITRLLDRTHNRKTNSTKHGSRTSGVHAKRVTLKHVGTLPKKQLPHSNKDNLSTLCQQAPFILIAVCSSVQHLELRNAIRNTWASRPKLKKLGIQVIFVTASPSEEFQHLSPALRNEADRYGDVLQVHLDDTYRTLSQKTLAAMRWVNSSCKHSKYFMKTDDDVFINVLNLVHDLQALPDMTNLLMGHVIENAHPITDRTSQWYAPSYKGDTYPTYVSGSAYIMSSALLEPILSASQRTDLFWLEDIYITGMLAKSVGARLVHSPKIYYMKEKSPCALQVSLSMHEMSAYDLYKAWKTLARPIPGCQQGDTGLHVSGNVLPKQQSVTGRR